MTGDKFRDLALELPEAEEAEHMNHPDFRIGGKIFATLGPDDDWGMVKLTPAQQASFVRDEPTAFEPVNGAWGKRGATKVLLKKARVRPVRAALLMAWKNTAPEKLARKHDVS